MYCHFCSSSQKYLEEQSLNDIESSLNAARKREMAQLKRLRSKKEKKQQSVIESEDISYKDENK